MSDFKNTTRTIAGHHNWDGNRVQVPPRSLARGGVVDRIDANPGHAEVYPKEGNRMQGNAAQLRKEAPTAELVEHGGRTPLTAGFKKGGPAKHFHVHKHYHAKGGRTRSVSHSYSVAEKHAEKFADGGHVHDCTEVPAGGPDYKRGGRAKPVKKNAGGALYATGGTVNKLAMGGVPMQGTPAMGALGRLAVRPVGMPLRQPPPMRRPVQLPGPQPLMRAKGGKVGMRKVAKQEVAKHVRTAPPRGHGVK